MRHVYVCYIFFAFMLLSAHVQQFSVSCMQDFLADKIILPVQCFGGRQDKTGTAAVADIIIPPLLRLPTCLLQDDQSGQTQIVSTEVSGAVIMWQHVAAGDDSQTNCARTGGGFPVDTAGYLILSTWLWYHSFSPTRPSGPS